MDTYRILSLDGGGIRGVVTAILLERLHAEVPEFLETVDLIAGTSTGGIIALGLAAGLSPTDVRRLYETKGHVIFQNSFWNNLLDLWGLRGADYRSDGLKQELQTILGADTRLKDLKKKVLITTFDLDNNNPKPQKRVWKPKFFHNLYKETRTRDLSPYKEDRDEDVFAYKVGLYTSAAPTYFPTVDGYIDGGVCANNPSMAALAQTQDKRVYDSPPPLSDICLFSLGTGVSLTYIPGMDLNWGIIRWANRLITLLFDGSMGIADYQCAQILGSHYHRLAPVFAPEIKIPLDGVSKIPELINIANRIDLEESLNWLHEHWK